MFREQDNKKAELCLFWFDEICIVKTFTLFYLNFTSNNEHKALVVKNTSKTLVCALNCNVLSGLASIEMTNAMCLQPQPPNQLSYLVTQDK